ncbi:DUF443 family protein [Staphylococcus sp. HMSC62A08]|uniref:DUF443 family protein n=1 Tax=Staphylococcus sp. HMSC62A08 TaxID=1608883 RepID=UPI0009F1D255|nr:DUF443 family protein [Staphylococcus sp. HMSC62A08]
MEKNSKYKIINYDNTYYIINLNRNKIFYIFPLLNYITRQPLIEVNENDLYNIKTAYISKADKNKRDSLNILGAGTAVLIATLTRSLIDNLNFSTNILINIMFVLIAIIPIVLIKSIVDRKKKTKLGIELSYAERKAFILPNSKVLFQNIIYNLPITFIFIATTYGFLWLKQTNIIFVFGIMIFLTFILFQNVILYAQTTIDGKIGEIKLNR